MVRKAFAPIALLFGGILFGYLLMLLVYMLPTEPMRENIAESTEVFDTEKEYPRVIRGYISTQLDNYTDSWMVGNAVYDNSEIPLWKRALTCTRAEYGEGPLEGLVRYCNGETDYQTVDYTRYWHGYLVILKPLFLIFDYADLRFINVMCECMLAFSIFAEFRKRGYKREAVAYVISLLFTMPIVIPLSIQFSVIYYVANVSMLVFIRNYERIRDKKLILLYFEIVGMATSFFDLLTYPIATLGMTVVCLLLLQGEANKVKSAMKAARQVICCSLAWGIGYGGMWAGKWIISTLMLSDNIIADAVSQIFMRSAHMQEGEGIDFIDVWLRNIEFYFEKPYLIVIAACVIVTAVLLIKNKQTKAFVYGGGGGYHIYLRQSCRLCGMH